MPMYLSIAAFPQNTQQLEALRTYALSTLIHTVLRDLNFFAVVHVTGGGGRGGAFLVLVSFHSSVKLLIHLLTM